MIRVAALTSGRYPGGTRFRVRQHLEPLAQMGVDVREFTPAIAKHARLPGWPDGVRQVFSGPLVVGWNAIKVATRIPGIVGSWRRNVTWLERDLLPGLPTFEGLLGEPLVFDVDDAVWLERPWGELSLRRIAQRAAVVIAGNSYLANWFSGHCSDVRVLPTTVDTVRFRPAERIESRPFTIGWTGSASNLGYLKGIEAPILRFLEQYRDTRLLVMADERPDFVPGRANQMVFWRWSEQDEVRAVQTMDVGLMPLTDDAWTRGKCSFKMLQYMACETPVICSPVGMNVEVLALADVGIGASSDADWYEALEHFYHHRDHGQECGRRGRSVVKCHFERRIVTRELAGIFHEVSGVSEPRARSSHHEGRLG